MVELSLIKGKIVTIFWVNWTFSSKTLCTFLIVLKKICNMMVENDDDDDDVDGVDDVDDGNDEDNYDDDDNGKKNCKLRCIG